MFEDTRDMRSKSEKYAAAFIKDDTDDEEEDDDRPRQARFISNITDFEDERVCCDCTRFLKPNNNGKYFKRCYECALKHKDSFQYKCNRCKIRMEKNYPNCFDCRKIIEATYEYKCKVCNKKMEKKFPTCFTCRTKNGKV